MPKKQSSNNFHILTGGPGSGKTSIIDMLRKAGYATSVEAGRGVIQDQIKTGGRGLPWVDPALFAELMLAWEIRSYRLAEAATDPGPVFFDRGVPDVLGYLRLMQLPVPEHIEKATLTFRYNQRVFIAPPWREIFHQDRERKQDFAEAVRTYDAMVATYTSLGYELIELPCVPLDDRVTFILEHVRAK